MNFRLNRSGVWPLAAVLMLTGTAFAASSSYQAFGLTPQSREADRLLRDIRSDARQVRTHAWRWDRLSINGTATWQQSDRQWNQIKPAVEDMQIKLGRIEAMLATLPAWERSTIASTRPLVDLIARNTHDLRVMLDKPNVNLTSTRSQRRSGSLAVEAGRLVRTERSA